MNTITAVFKAGAKRVSAPSLYQWDYGQVLTFEGLELPMSYEVHFSNRPECGQAEVRIGTEEGVSIPDKCLEAGEPVYAFVFLHSGENDGETVYTVQIPVVKRPKPFYTMPTSAQQSVITEAIAALNAAVQRTSELADSAEQSAIAAAESEVNAGQHANDAHGSADSAADSASLAGSYKDQAEGFAGDASSSALNASVSEDAALHSEEAATLSAREAADAAHDAEIIKNEIDSIVADSLRAAKESGEFDGERGDTGAVFTPHIAANGTISWTNNGNLPNPSPVDMVTLICDLLPSAERVTF